MVAVLWYSRNDRAKKADQDLFNSTARLGTIEGITVPSSGTVKVKASGYLYDSYEDVPVRYVREARLRSWRGYMTNWANPLTYSPMNILGAGGFIYIIYIIKSK